MRRSWVGAGVASLLVTGLTAPPIAATQPAADTTAQATVAPNPKIDETCGLDATLILDASGSINSAHAVNTVRTASKDLIAALKDTNSTLRVTQFATLGSLAVGGGQLSPRVPVNATTAGTGGQLSNAIANYYTPPPQRPSDVTISPSNRNLTTTNWQDGIKAIDRPELAIFVTDGDPNAYNSGAKHVTISNSSSGASLDNAITEANIVKTAGTRMLVVGVGNGITSNASKERLKKISGPVLATTPTALVGKTINDVDAVAFSDFAALGAFLRSVVTSLCGNSVTIQKLAQTSSGADYVPATGWDVTVQPTVSGGFTWVTPTGPDNSAQTLPTSGAQGTAAFQWKPKVASQKATVQVSESVNSGFTANRWTCEIKTSSGSSSTVSGNLTQPSFQFDMNPSDVATCKLYNDFNYAPDMTVTKVARDNPVRGNADGWNQQYTFTVTNTGNSALTITKPVDPQCSSITGPTGPGSSTGKLAPGDAWQYTCAAKIGPVATVTTPLSKTNTVTVTGVPPKGTAITRTAQAIVDIKTPRINIVKTAKKAGSDPPVVIPDGGTVAAGTRVTYVYTVTNTGNDVLNLVRATAVTDDKCSPVQYVSGDTGDDQKLGLSETWIYECTKVLNAPSSVSSITNTATVTSTWSNPENKQQNNGAVTAQSRMTINLSRSANLRVVKVTNPGAVDQDFGFTVSGQGVAPSDQSFTLNTSSDPGTSASRNIALDGPDGAGSQYTITETGVSGWDLTDLDCSKTPDSATGTEIKVTILPDENVTCSFTNQRRASLTIVKQTNPGGSTQEFDFTASGLSPSQFTLTDGQTQTFDDLAPGDFTIAEQVPAGWDLDDIDCGPKSFTRIGDEISLEVEYGDEVVCTFFNGQLPPANLTVVKEDVPATWAPNFDFAVEGTGLVDPGQPGSDTFSLGLGDSTSYSVRPVTGGNQYTITEQAQPTPPSGDSGFRLTTLQCVVNGDTDNPVIGDTGTGVVQVTLEPGDSAVCTYTNKQLPRLTIVKNAVNPAVPDDPTEFTYNATGLSPTSFGLTNTEQQVFTDVTAGNALTVEEVPVPDWTLTSLECAGEGAGGLTIDKPNGRVDGSLTYGDDVVCTYVNTKVPAKAYLFVLKLTDPQDATATFDFTATGPDLDEAFALAGGDYTGFEVDPGFGGQTYTVTEADKAGWKLIELDCVVSTDPATIVPGDLDTGEVSVDLLEGEVAVCVYENQKLGTLTVDKVTDVQSTFVFPFEATGVTPTQFDLTGGGAPQVFEDIPVGTEVSITEDVPTAAPDRWSLSSIECIGSATPAQIVGATATVQIGAGEDVGCTFKDAQVPSATVQIVKAADPADGTQFDFLAEGADGGVMPSDYSFSLTPDGGPADRTFTVYPAFGGENFTFTEEALPANWNLDSITCLDDGTPVGTADLNARKIDVEIDPGDSVTCTFSNREDATLTVVKEAPDDPTQEFDFEWTPTPNTFSLLDQEFRTAEGLAPGDYTVQEVNIPTDWYLDGPEGEHPFCIGTDGVDYTLENGATVTLAAGDDVLCVFNDFFDYNPQITLMKTVNRPQVLQGNSETYTYTVTNTGNVALEPVGDIADALVDDQCSPVQLQSGAVPLAPGETWTYTCTVDPMVPSKVTNVATATVQDPLDPQGTLTAKDTQTVEILVPGVDLVKTVDQPIVYPDTEVTYTYVATNNGQVPLEGPLDPVDWITDDKCSSITFVGGDTGDDSIMGVGEAWTYECAMPITADTTNEATFTGTPFLGSGPGKQTAPPLEVTATAEVRVIVPDITITKTPSAPGGVFQQGVLLVPVGSEVTYTYDVTSGVATTPMDVADITDDTCSPLEYQSGDTNDNGLVDPGETWVYTCKNTFAGVTTVTNTAVVTAVEPILGAVVTATDQATVTSYQGSIAIKKSPSAELVEKGTPVTYTYTVLNNGTVDLTDIKATDDKCAPVVYKSGDNGSGILKPGDEWVYECVSALQDDTTNVATATGTTPGGGKVTDSTSVTVLVVGGRLNPAIAVTKSPSATRVNKGGLVTYTYNVTNAGTMPLANIRVTDDKCAPVSYVSGDDNGDGLLTNHDSGDGYPDETWVYTCTTAISKDTTNTVTSLGSPWDAGQIVGKDVSAQAQATVTVTSPLPIYVDPVKKCKGDTCTVVKRSRTNKYGTLKYRTKCRPLGTSAAGEVSYCRTRVTKKGAVKVRVFGYRKVKVTVWITAKPKPKYKDAWKTSTWKRSWILRP